MIKPTILQILPALNTGGVEQTVLDVAQAVVEKGWNALVVSQGGRLVPDLKKRGAHHIDLPLDTKNPWHIWRNSYSLSQIMKSYPISVVHARSRAPAWSAFWATQKLNIPFVTTFHGVYNAAGPFKKKYNAIMTKGQCVIANSEFVGAHIHEVYDLSFDRIRVIPRGVDLKRFSVSLISDKSQQDLREELGLSREKRRPLLLLPGRLTSWKGQKVFIEALEHYEKREYDALLVGDDQGRKEYRQELESLIREKGLSQNVKIIGHRSDIPLILSLADVVISASTDPEAFGRIMIEAFAMEKPVIASQHGGALEIIEHGVNGLFFSPADSKALTEAIAFILSLPEQGRVQLGKAGYASIIGYYTKERMCALTLKVYEEILHEKNFNS